MYQAQGTGISVARSKCRRQAFLPGAYNKNFLLPNCWVSRNAALANFHRN